ncbi:MAG: caspase family protein [Saprospiraceae bacterium]|nr:caspase family protein [Saprospiraceae bacterium]
MKHTIAFFLFFLTLNIIAAQKPHLVIPIGNTQGVTDVAYSPDGKYMLTGSGGLMIGASGIAVLWDTLGHELQVFRGHESAVSAVAFSPNGKQVLTGSSDQTAKLWDLQGREIQTFRGHSFGISAVAFSPDGKYILTGGDETARLWDLQGKQIRVIKTGNRSVRAAVFSPNGKQILTATDDGTAKLWSLQGQLLQTFKEHLEIEDVAFSPDGKYILTSSWFETVKLWDIQGKELHTFEGHNLGATTVCFSPDGKQFVVGCKGGQIKFWDLEGNEIKTLEYGEWVQAVCYAPDGKTILVGGRDRSTKILDLQGRNIRTIRGHSEGVLSVDFLPANPAQGPRFLFGSDDKTTRLWDVEARENIALQGPGGGLISEAFSLADKELLLLSSGAGDGAVKLSDYRGQERWSKPPARFGFEGACFLHVDGRPQILATERDVVTIWDAGDNQLRTFEYKGLGGHIVPAPDGKSFVVPINNRNGYEFDRIDLNGQLMQTFKGHSDMIKALAFSPDGQRIVSASGGDENTVKIWDLQGHQLKSFKGHKLPISSVAFSPDGQQVLTGSWDNTAKLWDLNGQLIHTFQGHTDAINEVAFVAADGGLLALTGSSDNTAKLWDVQTGALRATLVAVDATDWVVIIPDGLFDASPGAMRLMYFVAGLEVIELEQLKERYFEPGLLSKILGTVKEQIRDVSAMNKVEVPLYPEITASVKEDQLTIQLKVRSGGLGKLSLFINGKEVDENLNTGSKTDYAIDLKTYEKYYLPGVNTLALRAYNSDNWLKSPAYELAYTPPAASKGTGSNNTEQPTLGPGKPQLFAIVVGTSDYSGTQLDLRFPDLDALAISQALQAAGKALFADRVHLRLLTSGGKAPAEMASKKNIAATFADFAKQAKPTDILLIYFSGHGINYGNAEKSQFYYLTKDIASPDLDDPDVRKNYTVSSDDLTQWLTAIPAQKQVMILDACNSGKVVEAFAAIGARGLSSSQIRAFDRMKDRTGMFILTGAAADKVSFEASQFGQGLLTYSLLQGMSGLALTSDKRVDVLTLFQYARDQVPELAKSIRQVQIPVLAFPQGGASFDIGVVDAGVKIPLAQVKPVFIRNVFQDENSFDDALGLTNTLAGYFQEITARGAQADLIYVDVNEYENAYSIKGLYSVDGNTVNVRGRLFQGKTPKGEFSLSGKKDKIPALVEAIVDKVAGML